MRAIACQYLLRTRQEADLATEEAVRTLLLADPSDAVRRAILLEEHPRPLPLTEDHLTLLLAADDVKARQVVLARLLAEVPPSQLFPGALEDRIAVEPDMDLRQRIVGACLQAGGAERLAVLGATLAPPRRQEILDALVAHGTLLPWRALAPLAGRGESRVDETVLMLLDPATHRDAWGWLLDINVRALVEEPGSQRPPWHVVRVAWQSRSRLLHAARSRPVQNDQIERPKIMALLAAKQAELAGMKSNYDPADWDEDEDDDPYYDAGAALEELQELIAALERL